MLHTDLVAGLALDGGVFIVQVVKLELNDFDLGILRQDLVQELRGIVKGQPYMANLSLGFQLEGLLIGPALLVVVVVLLALSMHQVKVKIVHTAVRQLRLKQRAHIRLGFEKTAGELVRQQVALSGVAACQAGAQGRLRPAVQIATGHVKIVKASGQEFIHHAAGLGNVDLIPLHWQTHKAEAQLFLHLFHRKSPCL